MNKLVNLVEQKRAAWVGQEFRNVASEIHEFSHHVTPSTVTVDENMTRIFIRNTKFHNMSTAKTLQYICNGVVINPQTWQILAIPGHATNNKYRKDALDEDTLKNATISLIEDGTIVTLYWFDGQWVIASKGSYDIGNQIMIDDHTYEELLYEIGSIDRAALDTNKSYTIGFKNKKYHMFDSPNIVWFVHAYDITTREMIFTKPDELARLHDVKTVTDISIDDMIKANRSAVAGLIDRNHAPHLGFIITFYANNAVEHSIIMTSGLYDIIDTVLYKTRADYIKLKTGHVNAICTFAYLSNIRNNCVSVFPQLDPTFLDIEYAINSLTDMAIADSDHELWGKIPDDTRLEFRSIQMAITHTSFAPEIMAELDRVQSIPPEPEVKMRWSDYADDDAWSTS